MAQKVAQIITSLPKQILPAQLGGKQLNLATLSVSRTVMCASNVTCPTGYDWEEMLLSNGQLCLSMPQALTTWTHTQTHTQVCMKMEVSCRLSHNSAESHHNFLSFIPTKRHRRIYQNTWSQCKLCGYTSRCDSNQTLWLFYLIGECLGNPAFLQKAASASRYLTEMIIHAGAVIWNLFLLFFFFVFLFWLSPAPTFQECLSTQSRPSCARCEKWLQISGSSANHKTVTGL